MCIIMYKPEGVRLPSDWERTINIMFDNNPDGAGIMYDTDQGIVFHKGLMDVSSVKRAIIRIKHKRSSRIAIHCRISTSGTTDQQMTHPFKLSNDKGDLRCLNGVCDGALMHNGVISGLEGKKLSDTANLTRAIADIGVDNIYKNQHLFDLVSEAVYPCRVLIFTKEITFTWGNWEEKDGIKYSNDGYKRSKALAAVTHGSGVQRYDCMGYQGRDWPYDYESYLYEMEEKMPEDPRTSLVICACCNSLLEGDFYTGSDAVRWHSYGAHTVPFCAICYEWIKQDDQFDIYDPRDDFKDEDTKIYLGDRSYD